MLRQSSIVRHSKYCASETTNISHRSGNTRLSPQKTSSLCSRSHHWDILEFLTKTPVWMWNRYASIEKAKVRKQQGLKNMASGLRHLLFPRFLIVFDRYNYVGPGVSKLQNHLAILSLRRRNHYLLDLLIVADSP